MYSNVLVAMALLGEFSEKASSLIRIYPYGQNDDLSRNAELSRVPIIAWQPIAVNELENPIHWEEYVLGFV